MSKKQKWQPWFLRPHHSLDKDDLAQDLTWKEVDFLKKLRSIEKNPATRFKDLPNDAQDYIDYLQKNLRRTKRSKVLWIFSIPIVLISSLIGTLFHDVETKLDVAISSILIAYLFYTVWAGCRRELAEIDLESMAFTGNPFSQAEEGLKASWERNYIFGVRTHSIKKAKPYNVEAVT